MKFLRNFLEQTVNSLSRNVQVNGSVYDDYRVIYQLNMGSVPSNSNLNIYLENAELSDGKSRYLPSPK